jgi:nucleoside phosphorylase
MREADTHMLHLGLEPYPWDQFAEEVAKTGETEFQVIEQRGSAEEVLRANLPLETNSMIGAILVVRSRTIVTALKMVSDLESAPQATVQMFSMLAEALPESAQVDLIISSDAVSATLGACADILANEWDIDYYRQDEYWKNLMVLWKNKRFRAVARKVDEEGLDADNNPFLELALKQVVQIVMDTIQELGLEWAGGVEPEWPEQ